ncbi:hypothetical protein, partial [Streptomyces sp. NPDC003395]
MDPRTLLDTWLNSGILRPSTVARYWPQVDSWLTWCETNGVHPFHARIEHVAAWSEDRYLRPYLDGRPFNGPDALTYLATTSPEAARTHDGRITAVTQYYEAAAAHRLIPAAPNLTD